MRKYNVAFCIHDFADMKVPNEITADFTYIRFHGPTSAKYFGSYSDTQLRTWAIRIEEWRAPLAGCVMFISIMTRVVKLIKNSMTLKIALLMYPTARSFVCFLRHMV